MLQSTVSIGKIVATFGLKGELVLSHGLGKKSDFKGVTVLFVEMNRGNEIPYFLENAKPKSVAETWIKFEGIDSKEAAASLLQKQVWMAEDAFQKAVAAKAIIALLGYTVIEDGKLIGTVCEVIEQPHQVLCAVMVGEKEVLIPLNESTLINIDRKKNNIRVSLPEGLLAIYLT
jgi:16S rRNA processing protein RimM